METAIKIIQQENKLNLDMLQQSEFLSGHVELLCPAK